MSATVTVPWIDANQRYLVAAVANVRAALERHIAKARGSDAAGPADAAPRLELAAAARAMSAPPALQRLSALFGLTPFERDVLVLCAAMELDAAIAPLCATAQGDPRRPYPTFSLALAALPQPHWSALTPSAPLRHWRLIEVVSANAHALTLSPLRIDERILHALTGIHHVDARLAGIVEDVTAPGPLVPSHQAVADRLAVAWTRVAGRPALPLIQLCGRDTAARRAIAAAACARLDLKLSVTSANVLPANPADLDLLIRLWEREAALAPRALLLDCGDLDHADTAKAHAVQGLVERLNGPIAITARERLPTQQRPAIVLDVPTLSSGEQRALWRATLGNAAAHLNGHVDALVTQFCLSAPTIQAAGVEALGLMKAAAERADVESLLWDACRAQARPHLDDLAQRLEPAAAWDDLVLPEGQRQMLREVAVHIRQRQKVYQRWGFAGKGARGLGISALFAGASGTGKTMAAEVLANELRLDLYRIDLSSVVSKYIGETEKNLRRVFDAAEEGGALLLFDEADALFGKRSEVKDSHDRYANIEVSYLLQRMESYRGLAILTTNLKSALDTAFLRRIRFVVHFPFPDPAQRAEIWRRAFPAATPTEGLDPDKLARLNVAGGNIRNIALNAAFLAADADEPVRMHHLLHAARGEYAKLEKPLTGAEVTGWVDGPGDPSGARDRGA